MAQVSTIGYFRGGQYLDKDFCRARGGGHECLNPMRPSPSRRRLSWALRLATVQSTRVTLVKIDLKTKEQRKPDGHIPPG